MTESEILSKIAIEKCRWNQGDRSSLQPKLAVMQRPSELLTAHHGKVYADRYSSVTRGTSPLKSQLLVQKFHVTRTFGIRLFYYLNFLHVEKAAAA